MTWSPDDQPAGAQHRSVALPGVGSFGQRFPGQRDAPVFDRSFPFAPVGIMTKLAAMLIDAGIYVLPFLLLGLLHLYFISLVIDIILFAVVPVVEVVVQLILLGIKGRTPGMAMLKMKVIKHPEGKETIGFGNGIVRWATLHWAMVLTVIAWLVALAPVTTWTQVGQRVWVLVIPALLTILWYSLIAWSTTTDRLYLKRGWHDRAANSVVHDLREDAPGLAELKRRRQRDAAFVAQRQSASDAVAEPARPPRQGHPDPGRRPEPAGIWTLSLDDGQQVQVRGPGLIGRDPQPDPGERVAHQVAVPDPGRSMSKTHASFALLPDGSLELVDRHSTNGVSVLRGRKETQLHGGVPFRLEAGDRVALGDRQMRVERR